MVKKITNIITLPKKPFDLLIGARKKRKRVSNNLEDFLLSLDKRIKDL
jgi:hypothetical protein